MVNKKIPLRRCIATGEQCAKKDLIRIVRNKEGRGIVALTCGYCTGCHLVLPQEFINKVRSNDKIYFCPNCSRTLYFKEDDVAGGENIFSAFGNADDDDDFFNAED